MSRTKTSTWAAAAVPAVLLTPLAQAVAWVAPLALLVALCPPALALLSKLSAFPFSTVVEHSLSQQKGQSPSTFISLFRPAHIGM